MKFFLTSVLCLLTSVSFGQGSRPPVTTLSGLSDVLISSPANGQALTYDGVSKWKNVAVPGGSLASLSDVSLSSPANLQLLQYSSGTSKWIAYGPLAFTDITGSVTPAQLSSTFGTAGATTYYRGDGAWGTPPVGSIPVTTGVLMGDGSGNAATATTLSADNTTSTVAVLSSVNSGDGRLKIYNTGASSTTSSVMLSGATLDPGATFRYYEGAYPTTGMIQNSDASLTTGFGRLLISGKNYILFSSDGAALATERARIGNGMMVGLTVDKGAGTVNTSGGYYVNGTRMGGVASVTATVDQTATTETAHVVYTVPANTPQIGTVYKIHASGNTDNGTTAITYTPKIRWGGTGGVDLVGLNLVTFASTTTAGTNRTYVFDARVTIRTIGASGTAVAEYGYVEKTTSATSVETVHATNSGTTAVTIDTTANKDLDLTWALSATTGTPHIRTISGNVEVAQP